MRLLLCTRAAQFIFVTMGGSRDAIELLTIGGTATEKEAVRAGFDNFDVTGARCFRPEDTEKLQGMIAKGFGGTALFNEHVQDLLSYTKDKSRTARATTRRTMTISAGRS